MFLFPVLPASLSACDAAHAVDEEAPAITRSVFEVWSQPDEQGVKQIFFGTAQAKHTHPSSALQVTVGSTDSSDAATIFAPTTAQFIVIEGGDRPALAYHEGLRAFGLAIADDLNDGSRVEGFLVRDDCGPLSCDVTKVGFDDNTRLPEDQRERFLIEVDRVASVSIAPVDDGFMVDFAYGGGGPYRLKRTTQASK